MASIITLAFGLLYMVSVYMAVDPLFADNTSIRNKLIAKTISEYQIASQNSYFDKRSTRFWSDYTSEPDAGYEYLKLQPYYDVIEKFNVSGPVSNDGYSFDRIVLAYSKYRAKAGVIDNALTLADSTCGSGSISAARSYCPQGNIMWAGLDSNVYFKDILEGESARVKRTITKLYRNYSNAGEFVSISDGTVDTLARLAGYNGNAANCVGIYVLDGAIPVSCDDMFNWWGMPITLNIVNSNRIYLLNTTSIVRYGNQVVIAEEASLE